MTSNGSGKKKNNLVFKIKTPQGLTNIKDVDNINNLITVDVIEFKSGKKLGTFKFEEFKLKFM
jgi:hypothetical protein